MKMHEYTHIYMAARISVICYVRCHYLLVGWDFCAHDTVLFQFLWANVDSNEVEKPFSIHKLTVGRIDQINTKMKL